MLFVTSKVSVCVFFLNIYIFLDAACGQERSDIFVGSISVGYFSGVFNELVVPGLLYTCMDNSIIVWNNKLII